MISNLEKYKKDLDKLISDGELLLTALQRESAPGEFKQAYEKALGKKKYNDLIKELPRFSAKYQGWYSEALVLLRQLMPDRLSDFIKLFEKPKGRKSIEYSNYVIEDCLQNLVVTHSWGDRKVGPEAAISQVEQQVNIVKAVKKRFESSLFDIRQLVQADLFDSELDAAKELNKKGFARGAGAIAGVVLEGHLSQVCANHKVTVKKKSPGINDFGQLLKDNDVIETPTWRKIQHLADLRNLCDHKKKTDPNKDDIDELIDGASKIIKTLF